MQSRRDQVQAHAFVVGRLVSAIQRADPDTPISPVRRFSVGTIAGILIAGLVMAGFAVSGVLAPGGAKSWRHPGALVVEKETGARYVFVDNELRPVLNYASARLILGSDISVARVSQRSLRGVPRGLPVGIPSAPDALPDPKRTDGRGWLVCSSVQQDATGAPQPFVTLWVGGHPAMTPVNTAEALLARAPTGQTYLTWSGRRMQLSGAALAAMGYASAQPSPVGWPWLNAVPAGPDLVAPNIGGRGRPGPAVDGHPTLIGQLYQVSGFVGGASNEYYVVFADGLAPVTPTGAALLLADPKTKQAYPTGSVQVLSLSTAGLGAAPRSGISAINPQLPPTPPKLAAVGPGSVPCVRLSMNAGTGPAAQIGIASTARAAGGPAAAGGGDRLLADRVVVDPGAGLLMRDQPAPGATDGALYLLVDTGVRYPLPSKDVSQVLGYEEATAIPVPATLLALVPVGPPLDPAAARATEPIGRVVGAGGGAQSGGR